MQLPTFWRVQTHWVVSLYKKGAVSKGKWGSPETGSIINVGVRWWTWPQCHKKKVEHGEKTLCHKSTTNHEKGWIAMLNKDYTANLLNLEDVIITDVKNLCNEVHISLQLPRKAHVCPACGAVTDRIHDYRMQTIKESCWRETPSCTFGSAATAALAASASLRKIPFCLAITASPAVWYPRSSMLLSGQPG